MRLYNFSMPRNMPAARGRLSVIALFYDYVFQHQLVEVYALGKVARKKPHGIELCIVEDMRLHEHGRADIQPLAYFRKIAEKSGVGELVLALICKLFYDFTVFNDFRPNSEHTKILLNSRAKVNGFAAVY